MAALAGSFAFAHKAIANLTPANAFEVVTLPEPIFSDARNARRIWRFPRLRPLRADGRVSAHERDCAAGEREVTRRTGGGAGLQAASGPAMENVRVYDQAAGKEEYFGIGQLFNCSIILAVGALSLSSFARLPTIRLGGNL